MSQVSTSYSYQDPHQRHFASSSTSKGRTSPWLGITLGAALGVSVASFGALAASTTGNAHDYSVNKKIFVVTASGELLQAKPSPAVAPAPDWQANLRWIKSESAVTISALSELFGVTRRAFYSWLDGTTPKRGGSQARIAVLRDVLSTMQSTQQRMALFSLMDETVDGETFREVFQSSTDNVDEFRERLDVMVAKLAPTLEQQERRLDRSGGASRTFETEFASS